MAERMVNQDILELARLAVERSDWTEARELLDGPHDASELDALGLDLWGEAAWWSGDADDALVAFEEAAAAFEHEGNPVEAARVTAKLAYLAARRQAMAVAGGWMAKTEALLDGQPESFAHGWLRVFRGIMAMRERDWEGAISLFAEAREKAVGIGDAGIEALATSFTGYSKSQQGDWEEALRLADAATLTALSGRSDLRSTGDVYCNTIALCRDLGEFKRASEWTEEAERWMRGKAVGGYPGVCQVHRAELQRLKGHFPEAEKAARQACIELQKFQLFDGIGFAQYEIGESRRRRGDLKGAQAAFDKAYEYGLSGQPGRSLLMMDQGDVEGAFGSLTRALDRIPLADSGRSSRLQRARLLPSMVDIALAAGDVERAEQAWKELDEVANDYGAASWTAFAATCRGAIDLAKGDVDAAVTMLSDAWRQWRDIDMPYESARARALLGAALEAQGDAEGAAMEYRAARTVMAKLGADRDADRLSELLGESPHDSKGDRVTRTFVFTDIVTSTDLIGLIGDSAWEDLIRWHDRLMDETIDDAGGEVVSHTGDGYFVAFTDPDAAIDWAVVVQKRLATHRRDHGFAPEVRIGIHTSEATERDANYSGQGVHIAARIMSSADGGHIHISTSTLDGVETSHEIRALGPKELKGITDPVDVSEIVWSTPSL